MENSSLNDVIENGAGTPNYTYHTLEDLTSPEIAMTDLRILAATVKRMYHCIVDEEHCSAPLFLDYAESCFNALFEVMGAYNTLTGQDQTDTLLHDLLGDDIIAAMHYDGGFDIDDEELNRFDPFLNGLPYSCGPWGDADSALFDYDTQGVIERYTQHKREKHARIANQAMVNMRALAATIKDMYHCIVSKEQFSFSIFLEAAYGRLYALSEEMDIYNGVVCEDEEISLEDILGDEIASAVSYYRDGGRFAVNSEGEEAAWNAYLANFSHGSRPWDEKLEANVSSYLQDDIEWYQEQFQSEDFPLPSCLHPVCGNQNNSNQEE